MKNKKKKKKMGEERLACAKHTQAQTNAQKQKGILEDKKKKTATQFDLLDALVLRGGALLQPAAAAARVDPGRAKRPPASLICR